MKKTALFAALALVAGAVSAQSVRTESEVRLLLEDEGYLDVSDIELSGDVWRAEATDGLGRDVAVRVDPDSGRVYSVAMEEAPIDETDLRVALRDEGLSGIRDVRYDDDDEVWVAEAYDPLRGDVEVEVDAYSGAIVSIEEE